MTLEEAAHGCSRLGCAPPPNACAARQSIRRASSGRSSCCVTCQVPLLRLPGWAHHHDIQALMPPDGQHALAASGSTTLTAADVAASGSPMGLAPLGLVVGSAPRRVGHQRLRRIPQFSFHATGAMAAGMRCGVAVARKRRFLNLLPAHLRGETARAWGPSRKRAVALARGTGRTALCSGPRTHVPGPLSARGAARFAPSKPFITPHLTALIRGTRNGC